MSPRSQRASDRGTRQNSVLVLGEISDAWGGQLRNGNATDRESSISRYKLMIHDAEFLATVSLRSPLGLCKTPDSIDFLTLLADS